MIRVLAGAAVIALAAIAAPAGSQPAKATTTVTCPGSLAPQECIETPQGGTGLKLFDAPGTSAPGQQILTVDPNNAPESVQDWYGFWEFGAPGTPGGLICTTRLFSNATCLRPNTAGVILYDSTGANPVVVDYSDALFVHCLEVVGHTAKYCQTHVTIVHVPARANAPPKVGR